jgi:hypothetical protein
VAASAHGLAAALSDSTPVLVVTTVGDRAIGSAARPADCAADGGDAVRELEELGDVVAASRPLPHPGANQQSSPARGSRP